MKEVDTRTPNRAHGLFAVLGAGLIIAGYFLPSYLITNPQATLPFSPSDYQLISFWDGIYATLGGGTTFNPQTNGYVATQPHIFQFIVGLAPIIMAAVILILGVWAFFRGPGSGRRAVFWAALVIVALPLISTIPGALTLNYGDAGNIPQMGSLIALGSATALLGVFLALVSGFLVWRHG